jgi:hypothetical protein
MRLCPAGSAGAANGERRAEPLATADDNQPVTTRKTLAIASGSMHFGVADGRSGAVRQRDRTALAAAADRHDPRVRGTPVPL